MATNTTGSDITDNPQTRIFNEGSESDKDLDQSGDNDISPTELELLDDAGTEDAEDDGLLDDTDEDGDELNEEDDLTGEDLDVPGSEVDDDDEAIGSEDEENNSYSLDDQDDEEGDYDDTVL